MIQLACPWCGYRNVSEFHYTGELVERPDPATATPEEWRSYLYLRRNPAGRLAEGWYHRAGCRRFFEAERDTTDNTVFETRRPAAGGSAEDPESTVPEDLAAKGVSV